MAGVGAPGGDPAAGGVAARLRAAAFRGAGAAGGGSRGLGRARPDALARRSDRRAGARRDRADAGGRAGGDDAAGARPADRSRPTSTSTSMRKRMTTTTRRRRATTASSTATSGSTRRTRWRWRGRSPHRWRRRIRRMPPSMLPTPRPSPPRWRTSRGRWTRTLAPVRGRPFLVFHDAYQYFEHRFDIPAAGSVALHEGVTPGTARVAALRDRVRDEGIVCAFTEPQFEPKLLADHPRGQRGPDRRARPARRGAAAGAGPLPCAAAGDRRRAGGLPRRLRRVRCR